MWKNWKWKIIQSITYWVYFPINFFKQEKNLTKKKKKFQVIREGVADWKVTIWHHLTNNQVGQEAPVGEVEWNAYMVPEHLPTKSLLNTQGKTL